MLNRLFRSSQILRSPIYYFAKLDKKPDLYSLLDVKPTATPQQINFNYYKLVKKYNPHQQADPSAHSKLLNEAFIILSNPKLREKYDKDQGYNQAQSFSPESKGEKGYMGKPQEAEAEYNQARSKFSELLGDKVSKLQRKILTIAAIVVFLSTLMLLFGSSSGQNKPGMLSGGYAFQQRKFERDFHTTLQGKL